MAFKNLASEADLFDLISGTEVKHQTYGLCIVEKVIPDMGVVLKPNNYAGSARKEIADANLVTPRTREIPLIEDDFQTISIRDNGTISKVG